MHLEENVDLRKHTSLHVGGPARYFVHAKSDDDVRAGLLLAQEKGLPFFTLGKGSNTVFPDTGYPGVIIHMEDRTLRIQDNKVTAASGVFMRQLINFCLDHGLRGLEELAGIPGTVGGAVRGNAGTWATETKDHLVQVEILKPSRSTGWEIVTLHPRECVFSYRESIFKRQPDWIILRATFALPSGDSAEGHRLVQKDLTDRHTKQPYDAPSAGSVFKNLTPATTFRLPALHPSGGSAPGKLSVGALIESCGLKGTHRGGAEINTKHANFIVNRGDATSQDVLDLIQLVQKTVQEKHGITLEPEIVIVEK